MRNLPLILAPMAGGPSTPELIGAAANGGAIGMVAGAAAAGTVIAQTFHAARQLAPTGRIGVNFFVPEHTVRSSHDQSRFEAYRQQLAPLAHELNVQLPTWRECTGGWDQLEQVETMLALDPDLVSFTFGLPATEVTQRIRAVGLEPWVTCGSTDMLDRAIAAGFTHVIVQGSEAGGHRSLSSEQDQPPEITTPSLVSQAQSRGVEGIVAAGGVASATDAQDYLAQGVLAVQVGSLFLATDESGVSPAGKKYLQRGLPTKMTRSFSGRPARGVTALVADEFSVPELYPELNNLTQPLRAAARACGRPELESLWVGQNHDQLPAGSAAKVIDALFPASVEPNLAGQH